MTEIDDIEKFAASNFFGNDLRLTERVRAYNHGGSPFLVPNQILNTLEEMQCLFRN